MFSEDCVPVSIREPLKDFRVLGYLFEPAGDSLGL